MTHSTQLAPPTTAGISPSLFPLLFAAAIGGAVSLALGVYGRVHPPTGQAIFDLGFSNTLSMKAWLATGAAALALAQAGSAMWMRFGAAPEWIPAAHRWTGTVAFLLTLPVAYHCLWSLGFRDTDMRVLAHSLLGCGFYGALVTKLLVLRSDRMPRWALPVLGGTLVTLLTALWFTSSFWFFTNVSFPGI